MKKLVVVLNLVCMFALGSFAQSMYGDAVKADVKMKYVYSFEEALKKAKEEHKLIFFNCFADWAIPCHSMNKLVFSNQEFADWMDKHFVNFFIDVTSREGKSLAENTVLGFRLIIWFWMKTATSCIGLWEGIRSRNSRRF